MYEKPSKYRYSLGILGYLLVLLLLAYVIIWICYYCSVFVDVAFKSKTDDFMNTLIIWSALKPGVALLIFVYVILTLYDPVTMFVLVVVCGVIWAGTLAINIKILVDRFSSCNSISNSFNLCNDPLYCCVYYDSVNYCADLGPCGDALNGTLIEPYDLKVNHDFHVLAIFNGIFVFLEFLLLITSFGVLLYMKKIHNSAVLTNKLLGEYYSNRENEEYENLLNDSEEESTEEAKEGEKKEDVEKGNLEEKANKNEDKTKEVETTSSSSSPEETLSLKSALISLPINQNISPSNNSTGNRIIRSDDKRRKITTNTSSSNYHQSSVTSRTIRQKDEKRSSSTNKTTPTHKVRRKPRENNVRGEIIQISQEISTGDDSRAPCCCFSKEKRWLPDRASIRVKYDQISNKIKESLEIMYLFMFYHVDTFTIREILVKRSNDKIFFTKKRMPLYKKK